MTLADSHVHLHAFPDPAGLLARARAAGVALVVGFGIDLTTSRQTLAIARRQPGVVAAAGLHPAYLTDAIDLDRSLAEVEALAKEPGVRFVGEIGIDLVEGTASLDRQSAFFEAQLRLAGRLGFPASLHVRGAFDEAFATVGRVGAAAPPAVVHYFVGGPELARCALALGLHLSVGKPVTRLANLPLRRAVELIPLDRLLLETDSYPLPGRTTEPADVRLVAEAVAAIKGIPTSVVAERTTHNLRRLLGEPAITRRPCGE